MTARATPFHLERSSFLVVTAGASVDEVFAALMTLPRQATLAEGQIVSASKNEFIAMFAFALDKPKGDQA